MLIVYLLLAALASHDAARCSLNPGPPRRGATATVLLATGSPDTMHAGPGAIQPSSTGGHTGSGARGPIYGQVFAAERFAGPDSSVLARTFAHRGDRRVVIVPWDYGPSCEPVRWTRSFAWVPIAKAATFTILLRPDSLWTNGVPVFDAYQAITEPYPLSPMYRRDVDRPSRSRTDIELTAGELYDLLATTAPADAAWQYPEGTWMAFARWQAAHPDLATRYPANILADMLRDDISYAKEGRVLRAISPIVAGTYRMSAVLDGVAVPEFFMRTRAWPTDEWVTGRTRVDPLEPHPRPPAYTVLTTGFSSLDVPPAACSGNGYINVKDPPLATARRKEWSGDIDLRLIPRGRPGDSALDRFRKVAFDEWSARWRASPTLETPARFWTDAKGVLQVEQTTHLNDGRTLTMRGERIDSTTVGCKY